MAVRQSAGAGAEVTASPAESAVRFRTAQADDALTGLLAGLVSAGLGVSQFREVQTDLEEAFMSVARENGAGDRP